MGTKFHTRKLLTNLTLHYEIVHAYSSAVRHLFPTKRCGLGRAVFANSPGHSKKPIWTNFDPSTWQQDQISIFTQHQDAKNLAKVVQLNTFISRSQQTMTILGQTLAGRSLVEGECDVLFQQRYLEPSRRPTSSRMKITTQNASYIIPPIWI